MKRGKAIQPRPYHPVNSRQGLIRELDRLVSLIVRKRDDGCICCGSKESLECGHFYKRRYHSTRWSLVNCNAQTHRCNGRHNVDPFPYMRAMQERYGADAVVGLLKLRDSGKLYTHAELVELRDELRRMLPLSQAELKWITVEQANKLAEAA